MNKEYRLFWSRQIVSMFIFICVILLFFVVIGKPPLEMLGAMFKYSMGDMFSLSETLGKMSPILFCALAVIVPARLGLISVGGQGQLYVGALTGTWMVLQFPHAGLWLLPAILIAGAFGGVLWGGIPGALKAWLGVHETISTLLLNYVGVLLVRHFVYGPWKNPASEGWPATISFPPNAVLPKFDHTQIHLGLFIALSAAVVLHILLNKSRWGLSLNILRDNPAIAPLAGLRPARQIILVMCLGGMLAGIGGIVEVSAIQGRLQPTISSGYGLAGFLVAWLSAQKPLRAIVVAFLFGALLAAADALQMFAHVPAASAVVLEAVIFLTALVIAQWPVLRGKMLWKR